MKLYIFLFASIPFLHRNSVKITLEPPHNLPIQAMHAAVCHFNAAQDRDYFDITHSFKVGSATYHILGLRKDRPTYGNTYYIFNCSNDQYEPKQQPRAPHPTPIDTIDDVSTDQRRTPMPTLDSRRARTAVSKKKDEPDPTVIKETLTEIMKTQRRTLVASFRKEMKVDKQALLRSIKKGREVFIQATTAANTNQQEIVHLLDEQKSSLETKYEQHASVTASSIELIKQTVTETLNAQHETPPAIEQLQSTLVRTIEQEVQKTLVKNDEIHRSTSLNASAISQLQNTLVQTIEKQSISKKEHENALNSLFAEQRQILTDTIAQQQQPLSVDLIKQTVLDALNEQHSASIITNTSATQQQQSESSTIINHVSHDLPIIESTSHRPNTKQCSSKQTDEHLFKVSIKAPEPAHLFAKLIIGGIEYSRKKHTLCQRDATQVDVYNCYIAPPKSARDGPYELTIYAKTNNETAYRAAISIRWPGSNITQSIAFPLIYQPFEEHQCILVAPLQNSVRYNEQVLIHIIIPGAHVVKIRNGDGDMVLSKDEYKNGVAKKKVKVRGDLHVCGRWDKKTDSVICVFNVV